MTIQSPDQNIHVISIDARQLTSAATVQLLKRADEALSKGATTLLLDMAKVEFLDSLAVACLVRLAQRIAGKARLVLSDLSPYALTVARVTHLDEVVQIYASRREFEASCAPSQAA